MAAMRFRQRRTRRWWYLGMTLAAATALAAFFVASSSANLTGSTFEGNDGNQVVNTTGNTDWQNAPALHVGSDLSRSQNDNAFGQGTQENDTNVTVVLGSIPNSKADLGRFADSTEVLANGDTMLYLAWVRNDTSGSVNFDFELNKKAQPDLSTPGPKTLVRTVGDVLINYSLQGGAQIPTLNYRLWNGTQWGDVIAFSSAVAEAGFNQTNAIANFLGGPATIPAAQFGEGAINMTAAGLIPNQNDPNAPCTSFASAYVKSRASQSFTSELKDFIAPVPFSNNLCGNIIIKKVTVPSPDPTSTSFSFNVTGTSVNDSFSLTDGGSHNVVDSASSVALKAGTYVATESDPGPNFVLTSFTCDDGSLPSAISLQAGETVTCTATNTLQLGAIQVTKTRKHAADGPGDHPESGVSFTVNGVTKQTDANGVACFDSLNFGTYTVHETVPAGESVDANDKQVTVDNRAFCTDNPYGGETVSFHNTPLTNLTASVDSQVDGGTSSTITCVDGNGNTVASGSTGANGDGSASASDLEPGTYTCTVVIDP
jgi:Prealbumin-like fold domain